ncbi:MAG: hypothetical protein LBL38_00410 [Lactobacillales bacterium]|jgi:hypothetical protein|nr:hypothetical protein [Lactobacillales bacterium]
MKIRNFILLVLGVFIVICCNSKANAVQFILPKEEQDQLESFKRRFASNTSRRFASNTSNNNLGKNIAQLRDFIDKKSDGRSLRGAASGILYYGSTKTFISLSRLKAIMSKSRSSISSYFSQSLFRLKMTDNDTQALKQILQRSGFTDESELEKECRQWILYENRTSGLFRQINQEVEKVRALPFFNQEEIAPAECYAHYAQTDRDICDAARVAGVVGYPPYTYFADAYYNLMQSGDWGCCRMIAGYWNHFFRNLGIPTARLHIVNPNNNDIYSGHIVPIYKIGKKWYVMDLGFGAQNTPLENYIGSITQGNKRPLDDASSYRVEFDIDGVECGKDLLFCFLGIRSQQAYHIRALYYGGHVRSMSPGVLLFQDDTDEEKAAQIEQLEHTPGMRIDWGTRDPLDLVDFNVYSREQYLERSDDSNMFVMYPDVEPQLVSHVSNQINAFGIFSPIEMLVGRNLSIFSYHPIVVRPILDSPIFPEPEEE